MQVCFPSVLEELDGRLADRKGRPEAGDRLSINLEDVILNGKGPRVRTIVRILTLHASFLERAKGDVDSSMLVLKRAIKVSRADS